VLNKLTRLPPAKGFTIKRLWLAGLPNVIGRRRFATSSIDKFKDLAFDTWATGCPILKGCLAAFECDIQQVIEAGDHVIIIGEVSKIEHDASGGRPLLYYRGKYGQIAAE